MPSSGGPMRILQELASAVAAALTSQDVAHALVVRTPAVLGARGCAVGLIEGDELVILDAHWVRGETQTPGARIPLAARTAITRSAREGAVVRVATRVAYERDFPDGATLAPDVEGAIGMPLRIAGEVVGALSIAFDEAECVDEETEAIARITADLAGQALERAQLYERERQSREALDRILRVAPRFHAETGEAAASAICLEARATLGADIAEIWELGSDGVRVLWREPLVEALPAAEKLARHPSWRHAVDQLEVTFAPDVSEAKADSPRDGALVARSALWIPLVGGRSTRLLVLTWHSVVAEPDRLTMIVARRFGDQAGIALDELDRRQAQADATRRAAEARRLQEVTAALSQAATATEVAEITLAHAVDAVDGSGGLLAVVRHGDVEDQVELLSAQGYRDEDVASWSRFPLDASLPLCEAIRTGTPVVELADDAEGRLPVRALREGRRRWLAVPLRSGGVSGAFQVELTADRELSDEDGDRLRALGSVCADALERSRLLEEEQRLRSRTERLQSMTSALSSAVTQHDVARIVVSQVVESSGASAAALLALDERDELEVLAWSNYDEDALRAWLEATIDDSLPRRALRARSPVLYDGRAEFVGELPASFEELRRTGHQTFLFLPLVARGRARSVVLASWREHTTLSREERAFLELLAGQAAQALERAQRFESERTIAETLQRSVLPESLPEVPGVQLAARYLPGTTEIDVGGDWFDAVALSNGRIGLAVGDVVGKGVHAAATMAQLRNALRAFSIDQMNPSATVSRLNTLADEVPETAFATVVYAVLDPEERVCWFTAAGHPPPLAVYPDGSAAYLEGGRGLPLGAGRETYTQDAFEVPVGASLVLYTDGLIERRGSSIDEGLERLRTAALDAPGDPERLIDHVLERLVGSGERGDDIAVLAIRLLATASRELELLLPTETSSLDLVRDALRVWLETTSVGKAHAEEVVLATWEACANAVEHGRTPESGSFKVRAEWQDPVVRVTIDDPGHWTEPDGVRERGLGLELMRSLMSTVEIDHTDGGTRVRLEKRVGAHPGF